MQELAEWNLGVSGLDAAADLRGDLSDFAPGSRNLIPEGQKEARPFRGLTIEGSSGSGGRKMVQIRDTWGSLDDDGATPGKGSLFSSVAEMLVYVGQGRVKLEGTWLGVLASNVLRFLLRWNGSYTDPKSGPYAAGLPELLAPTVGVVTNTSLYGAGNLNGTVSIRASRYRKTTGGRSRASAASDVVTVTNKAIYAVCDPIVSGQTHHIFFGTSDKLGAIGLHYRIARANPWTQQEYTEDDVERNVAITSVTSHDKLNAASGTFTAGDIGKLVENVSGYSIPAGTTITAVNSSTQVQLSASITVLSGGAGTVTLVSYVNSIRRAVVLNYKESDLIEETAWTLDFPPPTASHAFQLEGRMFLCSYADSRTMASETSDVPDASASPSSPGTALVASLVGQFESYDPRYPIYLPEKIIDVLGDGMESYKFVGGKNGIYAVQYLNVTNSAPATLTLLLRGEGIATPQNWCARQRAIYLYTGKGQPTRIVEGGVVDTSFAAKVRREMRDIEQADMVVFPIPNSNGVVYAAGTRAWMFDDATNRWSTELDLADQAVGSIISAVSTASRSLITIANGSTRTAYEFDEGDGSYIVGVGHYQESPQAGSIKIVQKITATGETDVTNKSGWLCIFANTLPTHDVAFTTNGDNEVLINAEILNDEYIGSYVLIKEAGTGGDWLYGRITAVDSPIQFQLGTPERDLGNSVALEAGGTTSNAYCLIAKRIFPFTINRHGTFEVESPELFIPGFSSYAVAMMLENDGVRAQPLRITLSGTVNNEEGWKRPSTQFG